MPNAAPELADTHDSPLTSLGIALDGPGMGTIRAACATIARRIITDRLRVVGFIPSSDRVAVPPVMIHLGLALCDLTGATVGVVDANVRYPGLPSVARGLRPDHDDSVFTTRWLRGSLALLSPPHVERSGEVVPQLARVLLDGSDLFAHVLVDLTGFELLGAHAAAAACMDAVTVVCAAHRSREQEVVELCQLMPRGRLLGVLLVG